MRKIERTLTLTLKEIEIVTVAMEQLKIAPDEVSGEKKAGNGRSCNYGEGERFVEEKRFVMVAEEHRIFAREGVVRL